MGELIYFKNINKKWSENVISNLDLQSNKYKYLNLILYDDKISILCSYSNLVNPIVWNIQYISIRPSFEKRNVTSIIAGKNFSPFNFSIDKFGSIHLLYRSLNNNSSDIYYMSFNPFINVYRKPPMKISSSSEDNLHPYIFIDSKDQVHTLWTKVTSNNFNIECKSILSNKNKFQILNIPNSTNNIVFPVMFEENGILKIVYSYSNSIGLISSNDHGTSWYIDRVIEDISRSNLYLSKYSSNYYKDNINNIRYCYAYIDNKFSLIFSDNFADFLTAKKEDTENISIKQDLQIIENKFIEKLLFDLNSSLESSAISSNYMSDLKNKVEKTLYSNIVHLDKQLYSSDNHYESIKNIEFNLNEHKQKNKDLVDLLSSLKTYYEENSKTIEKLEYDLANLKEFIEDKNNGFLKKFFLRFK
ncbi:hypothetical protein Curi_c13270 [Gottschalkia acidurici 9a]|uniref:Uncharacterized protein n=1 Tax=Gottschalkia acidurici (strain ATCC 7906 / DSM 604 / BCRC 14475 / CIP 104303 / KCTC 5404 / NCIMB 10678 / 9a) TaxID=1128398 RepID=K0AX00_GOTA9|nr:hypothetical protein [Gottschalkia acidurici]AFS78338.1 hypothetical protein Curi_c13270 [Gottschalkia acidurici 9a]